MNFNKPTARGIAIFVSLAIVCGAIMSCTESPTATVDASAKQNKIDGTVALADFRDPAQTLVWLEGFNLSTRAGSTGEFALQLPEKGLQSVLPGGVEGVFKLYFFNANYFIKTLDLVVLDGEFVFGKGDLLSNGELNSNPTLANIVTIRTELSLPQIREDYDSTLTASVLISPVDLADTVDVVFPELAEQSVVRLFFEGIDTENRLTLISNRFVIGELGREPLREDELQSQQQVRDRPILITIELDWRSGLAEAGEYRILPFLWIEHQNIPADLLEILGVDPANLLENYQNIPYGIDAANLVVRPVD